ncbi:MAG: response regulator transcription factor [Gemmatimonadota bacterium]
MSQADAGGTERDRVEVLLASARDWFASALQAVLEPEGFRFQHVRSGDAAVREAALSRPDVVILDEGLPDNTASELCRELVRGRLGRGIPILVYSPNFWHETEQAEAMRAGAWDIIREPIRSRLLVAKLRRLLRIKELIETTGEGSLADAETGLFNLAGLIRTLPILGSLAERSGAPLSCAVLGPTALRTGEALGRQRAQTAHLCTRHTRASDVCAWLGDTDLALVAYDCDVEDAGGIVRRLSGLAERSAGEGAEIVPLSAGIVPLPTARSSTGQAVETEERVGVPPMPGASRLPGGPPIAEQIASLSRFAAGQNALREARKAGGGIRVTEAS